MGDAGPDLRMMNLIVRDMASSVEFYGRLGVTVPEGEAATGVHVQLRMPSGFSLELDTAESASWWHAGWRDDPGSVAVVVCFAFATREAVDATYADLTGAGYAGRQPPYDAFWGARWAIVADPDGNDIGLMSPMDDSRQSWPPTQSPDP
jgi:predicted lactoylglutathione lyase